MKKAAICFTGKGMEIIRQLNKECKKRQIEPAAAYVLMKDAGSAEPDFSCVTGSLDEWTKDNFDKNTALIFVGAVGIAVRAISGSVKDKLSDSPVIVVDDNGNFVIPVLSGHAGGGNKLAQMIAKLLDAIPVITTSTDNAAAFSADVFAAENRLKIINREGIKKVSAKAVEGKNITLSIKDYPPSDPVDIIVADETDREYSLLLSPKEYVVGIGMKKDKDEAELESFFLESVQKAGINVSEIYALGTIDIKENEKALLSLRDKYRIPVISFDNKLLGKAPGDYTGSEFVQKTVGVDNVCERAAVLACGGRGDLILRKHSRDGMTIAIAKRAKGSVCPF